MASDESGLSLRADPSSIAPERALVFEVAGSIDDIYQLVTGIRGLEFLTDEEAVFDPDEDFFQADPIVAEIGRSAIASIKPEAGSGKVRHPEKAGIHLDHARDHDTIEAGEDASDLVLVTFNERIHRGRPMSACLKNSRNATDLRFRLRRVGAEFPSLRVSVRSREPLVHRSGAD